MVESVVLANGLGPGDGSPATVTVKLCNGNAHSVPAPVLQDEAPVQVVILELDEITGEFRSKVQVIDDGDSLDNGTFNYPSSPESLQSFTEHLPEDESPKPKKRGKNYPPPYDPSIKVRPLKLASKTVSSDDDDEPLHSNIPLSQRKRNGYCVKSGPASKKKKILANARGTKAERDILNDMENPRPSTSAALVREMARIQNSIKNGTILTLDRTRDAQSTSPFEKSVNSKSTPRRNPLARKLPLTYLPKKLHQSERRVNGNENENRRLNGNGDENDDFVIRKKNIRRPVPIVILSSDEEEVEFMAETVKPKTNGHAVLSNRNGKRKSDDTETADTDKTATSQGVAKKLKGSESPVPVAVKPAPVKSHVNGVNRNGVLDLDLIVTGQARALAPEVKVQVSCQAPEIKVRVPSLEITGQAPLIKVGVPSLEITGHAPLIKVQVPCQDIGNPGPELGPEIKVQVPDQDISCHAPELKVQVPDPNMSGQASGIKVQIQPKKVARGGKGTTIKASAREDKGSVPQRNGSSSRLMGRNGQKPVVAIERMSMSMPTKSNPANGNGLTCSSSPADFTFARRSTRERKPRCIDNAWLTY